MTVVQIRVVHLADETQVFGPLRAGDFHHLEVRENFTDRDRPLAAQMEAARGAQEIERIQILPQVGVQGRPSIEGVGPLTGLTLNLLKKLGRPAPL